MVNGGVLDSAGIERTFPSSQKRSNRQLSSTGQNEVG